MSSPSASKGPLLRGALGLVLFLCVWEAVPRAGLAPSTLLPAPSMLPAAFLREFNSGIWLTSVGLSLGHYLLGLAAGVLAGVCLGVATGLWRGLEESLAWVVRVLRPIPGLAWVPFAILWFGVDQSAAIFIIAVGVFWIVFFAAQGAIRGVDRDFVELAEAFGFRSAREKLVKVLLPAAAPGILVGVRTALGQAWMAVVAAELFGVAGLGQRMNQASSLLATDIVVVYMLTMAALYGIVDTLFVAAQSRLLAWKA
jgi:sulfonate transport system permease protein